MKPTRRVAIQLVLLSLIGLACGFVLGSMIS
jgi:hypothetical protein